MKTGRLVQWNDERGFGFIEAADGERYFVHISAIGRIATRPRAGDSVRFAPKFGPDGRPQAKSVTILGANPPPSREARMRGLPQRSNRPDWRAYTALVLAGLVSFLVVSETDGIWLATLYIGMGALSLFQYGADKDAAEAGRWRISEIRLHTVDFAFGIIGGLLGQAIWRHKTRKAGYVASTIVIAGLHLLWLMAFATGQLDFDALWRVLLAVNQAG